MQPTNLAQFLAFSGAALSMSATGLALVAIGLAAAKNDIVQACGIDKIVALTHLCFAIPLAVDLIVVHNRSLSTRSSTRRRQVQADYVAGSTKAANGARGVPASVS